MLIMLTIGTLIKLAFVFVGNKKDQMKCVLSLFDCCGGDNGDLNSKVIMTYGVSDRPAYSCLTQVLSISDIVQKNVHLQRNAARHTISAGMWEHDYDW